MPNDDYSFTSMYSCTSITIPQTEISYTKDHTLDPLKKKNLLDVLSESFLARQEL